MAPVYEYKAYSAGGKAAKGIVEAENQKAARQKLRKQGLAVFEIAEKTALKGAQSSAASNLPFLSGRVGVKDLAMMTRQLASLVKANITLVESLGAMVEQSEVPQIKLTLAQVRQDVNEGISLSKAMAKHPKVFDPIFVNMIEAGESSGTLGQVLIKLAELKEGQMRLRAKIIAGMTYPGLMMFVGFVLFIALFTFVIPQLKTIFDSMKKEMPPITAAVMWVSDMIVGYWPILLGGMVGGAFLFNRWKNGVGRPAWDGMKLRIPIVGPLVRMIGVTRFASTMATLLSSGVPILSAMNIARNIVGNTLIAAAISSARENITEGQSIADPLRRSGQFPPLVIHMIAIGEKTGELPAMLNNVAETYEEQVSSRIEGLTSLLEPIMIIIMGGMVGFIVMAVFVPLLDLSNIQ